MDCRQSPSIQPLRADIGRVEAGPHRRNGCPPLSKEVAGREEGAGAGVEGGVSQTVETDGEEGAAHEVEGSREEEGIGPGVGDQSLSDLCADAADLGVDLGEFGLAMDGGGGLRAEQEEGGEGGPPCANRGERGEAEIGVAVGGRASILAGSARGGEGEEKGGQKEEPEFLEKGQTPGLPGGIPGGFAEHEDQEGHPQAKGEPGPRGGTKRKEEAWEMGQECEREVAFGVATDGFAQKDKPPAQGRDKEEAEGEHALEARAKRPPIGKGKEKKESGEYEAALFGPEGEQTEEERHRPRPQPAFEAPLFPEDRKEEQQGRVGVHTPNHPGDRFAMQWMEGPQRHRGQRAPARHNAPREREEENGVGSVDQGVHQQREKGPIPPEQCVEKNRKRDQRAVKEGDPLDAILRTDEIGEHMAPILDISHRHVVVAAKLPPKGPVPAEDPREEPQGGEGEKKHSSAARVESLQGGSPCVRG